MASSANEKLANLFNSAGVVDIAEVIYNRDTEQSRGFGFVTMSTVEEAEKVVDKFNGYDLSGRALTVNKAAPRGSQPEKRVVGTSFKIYVVEVSKILIFVQVLVFIHCNCNKTTTLHSSLVSELLDLDKVEF
ncbi:unnamed protein product [Lactuca virosa]|uniref:RRM domain-containing protein n=1 Tax=Lactuca virosa TaxID=75947 RepID=A0AAU9PDB1_9ASTR|nr:unnamed protein product [Lactuca virosa]